MSLETKVLLGQGGIGFHGHDAAAVAMLAELQGLNISLLTGAGANTKIDLAAIRSEDTIVGAINNNAGTLTDIKAAASIVDVRATGTVTVGTVAAGDTVTVAGLTYTLVANDAVVQAHDKSKVKVGASANDCAANLAAAINAREASRSAQQVSASVLTNVVTVTAIAEGTSGNALTLAETGNTFAVSGATLAGGTATGGIKFTGVTNQVILFWFNKR